MPKQRHLSDLYLLGKEEVLDDGRGEVRVWVQKLNTMESELARRRSDAARSRLLSLRSQPDSDSYLAAVGDAYETTDISMLVATLLAPEAHKRRQVRESEVAFRDEWAADGYLQGLRDSWMETLAEVFALDPEDPEANRVFDELRRYQAQVAELVDADLADHRSQLETVGTEDLQARVAEENLKAAADMVWMAEFRSCTVWAGVRDVTTRNRYFAKREQVDDLQQEVFLTLYAAISNLTVDSLEGKDSPETPPSSPSSEQHGAEEMAEVSGLVGASQ